MSRNVMSPTIARRLRACAHKITKPSHHARLSTTPFKAQETPSERQQDHLDRIAWMQAEDLRRLAPIKAKIKEYQAECDKAHEFLASLPAALEPLESLSPARPLKEHRAAINLAMESLNRLKDKKLPNLLANVEDLEIEVYPEPGSQESELAFMQSIGGMTAQEKQDKLRSLTRDIAGVVEEASRCIAGDRAQQERDGLNSSKDVFAAVQLDNPLDFVNKKKSEVGEEIRAGDKLKFGLSTEEQFASVVAGATKVEDAMAKESKKKLKASTANFGLGEDTEDTTASEASVQDSKKAPKKEKKKMQKEDAPTVEPADATKEATTSDAAEPTKPVIRKSFSRLTREIKQTIASNADNPAKPADGPTFFRLALESKEATPSDAAETTKPVTDTAFSRLAREMKETSADDPARNTTLVAGSTLSRLARDPKETTTDGVQPTKSPTGATVSRLTQEAKDTMAEKLAAPEAESPPTTSPDTPPPKPSISNLSALQAQLEASWKRGLR